MNHFYARVEDHIIKAWNCAECKVTEMVGRQDSEQAASPCIINESSEIIKQC